jgi:RND family efflux transporter MFP subunit
MARVGLALRIVLTLAVVTAAIVVSLHLWRYYMNSPWTRDGRVRAEVVEIAPEVAGRVTALPIIDNQRVAKGDLLFAVDPERYKAALDRAEAAADRAKQLWALSETQARRRANAGDAVSADESQRFSVDAAAAAAAYREAEAAVELAEIDQKRTEIRSPVNGFVTNLELRVGDYATPGKPAVTVVDGDSFWVSGYFEETKLRYISAGESASIVLMGERGTITGHVESIARGIHDRTVRLDSALADVDPVFTWVRLAQRIPVRIAIDTIPDGVQLSAGMTCTIVVGAPPKLF